MSPTRLGRRARAPPCPPTPLSGLRNKGPVVDSTRVHREYVQGGPSSCILKGRSRTGVCRQPLGVHSVQPGVPRRSFLGEAGVTVGHPRGDWSRGSGTHGKWVLRFPFREALSGWSLG